MQRLTIEPRPDWQAKVEEMGLFFHTFEGKPYWFEGAFYSFTSSEIDRLEKATNELQEMCLKAVDYVIENDRFADLRIPAEAVPVIKKAWDDDPPAVYGRFDFGYDGDSIKLFEYNADTPTALLEAAVIQWHWLQDRFPREDQFNSIWEGLVQKWKDLKDERAIQGHVVHFAHMDEMEDLMTTTMLRDTAIEAGLQTEGLHMSEIGWDEANRWFVDANNARIRTIFKLYPWEWLVHDQFGKHALENYADVQWIEPIWKMVLSNKGILAILWEMYPNHPYLLESHLDDPKGMVDYVKKPLLSREGANVTLAREGTLEETPGEYGEEGFVYQELYRLPDYGGAHPVIGSWVVDCEARGIGIRESDGLVTDNYSRFVPHMFSSNG
jgi:glutathionylspermidine synthase